MTHLQRMSNSKKKLLTRYSNMLVMLRTPISSENEYSKKLLNSMLVMLMTPVHARNDVSAIHSKKKLLDRHSEMLVMLRTPRDCRE